MVIDMMAASYQPVFLFTVKFNGISELPAAVCQCVLIRIIQDQDRMSQKKFGKYKDHMY